MNAVRALTFHLLLCLCCSFVSVQAQQPDADHQAQAAQKAARLSPGAQEAARLIGVAELIERYQQLPAAERQYGRAMSQEALMLRLQINEAVLTASLEADGVLAELDSEIEKLNSIRAFLESRRDHALAISAVASLVTGGVGGVVGTSLQLSESTSRTGNIIGVAGGAISTFLSALGIHQQHGGRREFHDAPNMLAPFFDRKGEYHARYPDAFWQYLNSPVPTEPQKGTRRERLHKDWIEAGRIAAADSGKGKDKIAFLTSASSENRRLTLDLLSDRAAMLAGIRVWAELMKRDLSKLMLALRAQ